ncbi:MAG TPA: RnfH family protein [Casimicrobiaceae bacterium]|nr:RnfH family protein [Casimicrobiaceae bacterium]
MKRIAVTVVYALPAGATEIGLTLPAGASVAEALALSEIAARHPEIDLAAMSVGVFGVRVALDTRLSDGDRVEIYRPLQADPKDLRRRRANRRSAD